MNRVMIIGGSGSGKSTVARRLGDLTALPVIHIDQIFWQPGWRERPEAERHALLQAVVATERWIIDGNYSSTFEMRAARADTLIFLDISTPRRIARVLWRTARYFGRSRPDITEGCPERLDASYYDFVVNWVGGYQRRGAHARALAFLDRARSHCTVHHLRTPSEVRHFLEHVDSK